MMVVVAAIVGSGMGAVARYGLAGFVQGRILGARPWGTATVNVLGAVFLGLVTGMAATGRMHPDALTILGVGFCGGFTTFSTWMVESVQLGREGAARGLWAVAVNVAAMLVAGVAGAAIATTVG